MQWSLNLLQSLGESIIPTSCHAHVVAQIIKAKFIVGGVSDVAGVSPLTFVVVHPALDVPNGHAQAHIQRCHPFHIASGQVVVHGNDVNAFAFERIEIGW